VCRLGEADIVGHHVRLPMLQRRQHAFSVVHRFTFVMRHQSTPFSRADDTNSHSPNQVRANGGLEQGLPMKCATNLRGIHRLIAHRMLSAVQPSREGHCEGAYPLGAKRPKQSLHWWYGDCHGPTNRASQ
jgi:hypothetical protein